MYLENEFLDEEEADAFLSTLPVGTDSKKEIREVTDQLFGNGEGDEILLPPQTKPLDEYLGSFTDSQRQAFEWIKHNGRYPLLAYSCYLRVTYVCGRIRFA